MNDSFFMKNLRVEKFGPHEWMLTDDLAFFSAELRAVIVAPAGFQTDFASIPRPLWAFLPPVDAYDPAAVMHDSAYAGALVTANGERIRFIKHLADKLFLECLKALDINVIKRQLMYRMVVLFGDPKDHPLADNAKALNQSSMYDAHVPLDNRVQLIGSFPDAATKGWLHLKHTERSV